MMSAHYFTYGGAVSNNKNSAKELTFASILKTFQSIQVNLTHLVITHEQYRALTSEYKQHKKIFLNKHNFIEAENLAVHYEEASARRKIQELIVILDKVLGHTLPAEKILLPTKKSQSLPSCLSLGCVSFQGKSSRVFSLGPVLSAEKVNYFHPLSALSSAEDLSFYLFSFLSIMDFFKLRGVNRHCLQAVDTAPLAVNSVLLGKYIIFLSHVIFSRQLSYEDLRGTYQLFLTQSNKKASVLEAYIKKLSFFSYEEKTVAKDPSVTRLSLI